MTLEQVEIALFAAAQIGILIYTLGRIQARVDNFASWLSKVDARSQATADLVAKHEGEFESIRQKATYRRVC